MATGKRLTGPEKVRQLQTVLHAKAKEEPGRRFHALIDKVWREDFLAEAYRRVRRNRGSAGVDGEDFADIESYGPAHRRRAHARPHQVVAGECRWRRTTGKAASD